MKELMSSAVISGLQPSSDLSDGVRCRMKRAAVTPAASEVTATAHTHLPTTCCTNSNKCSDNNKSC